MKTWLCIEDGERFTVKAQNLKEAQIAASMWNAEVIRELSPEEVAV
jgi:hypothetical protein